MSQDVPIRNLNPNIAGLGVSATVGINDLSNKLITEGRRIYKLGLGESPFPVPDPVVQALRTAAHKKSYLQVRGLYELREAVAEHHFRNFGIRRKPQDVFVGPGSKELMFLLQLVYYGDLVIPSPSWVSYAPQAQIIGREIYWVDTRFSDSWMVQAEDLDRVCHEHPDRPRLLIINYPNNPTGRTYSIEQLKDLADVARENRVVVLSDEIYGRLHHDGEHKSMVELYPEGTILSGGLSKWCGAGGWRLGLFIFPENLRWLLDGMAAVGSETFTSTSGPIQYAAVTAFQENEEIEHYIVDECRILKALGNTLARRLDEAGALIRYPQGGFYLFPDFSPFAENLAARGITTSRQMCERLLEDTGVAILPGENFGRPPGELSARLAYVDFDGGAALEGLQDLPEDAAPGEAFLKKYCGAMLEAVDRICEWIR